MQNDDLYAKMKYEQDLEGGKRKRKTASKAKKTSSKSKSTKSKSTKSKSKKWNRLRGPFRLP